jgi:hypothetical protein
LSLVFLVGVQASISLSPRAAAAMLPDERMDRNSRIRK